MKYDTLYVTHDFFLLLPSLSVSVRFGIGATILTRQEIQCLLYAGFWTNILIQMVFKGIVNLT